MAETALAKIAGQVVRQGRTTRSKPHSGKPQRVKSTNPEPRVSDEPITNGTGAHKDFLGMLKDEFKSPFLSLLEEYAKRCSPKHRVPGHTTSVFVESHKLAFWICFICDFVLLLFFLYIVLLVVLRGLNLNIPFPIVLGPLWR